MTKIYTYDSYGNLAVIKIGGQKVWELKSNTGTQRTVYLGTTPLVLTTSYDFNGLPKSSIMKRGSTTLHSFGYTFDGATGNLKSRTGMQSGTENFTYDAFDRLTTGTSYSVNGNIASKTGIGKYTYDANKKHAVVQVQNTNNLIQGTASLSYNAFNKVATVTQGTYNLTITYGPDRQRTKTVLVNGSNTTTTLYADNYEQRTINGTTTSYHYVVSPDGLAAVYVKTGNNTTAYYIETDYLGSIVRAYDYVGNTKFSATYDAWGKQTITKNAIGLTRGYTGHEHWPQFGLIDMNGRFYDPLIGRFLSPDPCVQMPDNLQNLNRYSYCLNNPLKYTDPSGNIVMTATAMGIFISAYMGAVMTVGSAGVAGNVNSVGEFFLYSGIGSLAGFAGGYVGVAVSGLGNIASSAISCAVSNSINGAGITWANGGSFSEGLAAGGLGGLSGGISGGLTSAALGGASALLATGGFNGEINVPRAELQSFDDCPIMNSTMLEEVTITAKAGSYAAAQQNILNQIVRHFNTNAAVEYLHQYAHKDFQSCKDAGDDKSCARFVRRAVAVGFGKVPDYYQSDFPTPAREYGATLEKLGFRPINTTDYIAGDIAVIQGYPGGTADPITKIPYGHVQMHDGTHWISSFKQAGFYPGPGYRKYAPNYVIYRYY